MARGACCRRCTPPSEVMAVASGCRSVGKDPACSPSVHHGTATCSAGSTGPWAGEIAAHVRRQHCLIRGANCRRGGLLWRMLAGKQTPPRRVGLTTPYPHPGQNPTIANPNVPLCVIMVFKHPHLRVVQRPPTLHGTLPEATCQYGRTERSQEGWVSSPPGPLDPAATRLRLA